MLPRIKEHSFQVARVAGFLARNIITRRPELDLALIEAGALLHDIAKTECLRTKGDHVKRGEEMLLALGFPSLARILSQHVRLSEEVLENNRMDEAVLVHYADKRVLHDDIVDLENRFDYLKKTYGRTPEILERIELLFQETRSLEERIFAHLSFSPQDLKSLLSKPNDPAICGHT